MTVAMYGLTVVFGVWAALAHLGFAGWIDPLGLLASLLAISLLVIMLISAKRGLFRPR